MRVVLLREVFAVALCALLAACGGSGGEAAADNPVVEQPPVTPPVSPPPTGGTPVDMGLMVAFGYNSLAAGAPLRADRVQNLAVGNGTATYRFPRSGESISGNLTIAVDVADPDGIARVLVGFNGSEQALVLCNVSCGTSFSQTVTGVNPRNFGLTPGSLRLELWLEDLLGNRILFDARDIEWLPQAVAGVNTRRSGSTLQVNWAAANNARRYNLYIAEQPGITPQNILNKTGGRQFLALTQPNFTVPSIETNSRYFVLITGVDSSGESLFSEQHVVQPAGAPQFSSPIAVPDQFSLNEDEEFSGFLLGNDSHPDDSNFRLDSRVVRAPDNGSVLLNADGSFVYKPVANFVGNDSFIYQITDTQGLTAQALVSLAVLPVNDVPIALDDSYSLNKNTNLTVAAMGVLANDSDIDGDTLVVDSLAVTAPSHGSVQLNPDGSFSYTPVANYAGEDFFIYRLTDGQGGAAQAKVTLRIEMTNAAPIARNDSYQVGEDEQLLVNAATGVLSNDTDPDGDSIALVTELLSVTQNGQLLLAEDGSFSYIPRQDFYGIDSFSYQIKDPAGLVSSATVELRVIGKNDPPVVQGSSYSVNQNTLLTVSAPGLLVHASDVDDQTLSIVTTAAVAPTKGTLTLSADGGFSYQPTPGATGTDSFIFQVKDAAGAISTGTVVISIIANPIPPVFSDMATEVWDNVMQGAVVAQFVVADSAPGTSISFSIVAGNPLGIFSLSPAGVLSIADPAPLAQLGGTSILLTVRAQDSTGLSAQANSTIAVRSTAVTAQNDSYSVQEDGVLNSGVSVLSNDVDLKGVGLTASLVTPPAHGSLLFQHDGHFTYSPAANFFGQDSFVYQASNGIRTSNAVVTISVVQVLPALLASFDAYTLAEDTLLTVSSAQSLLQNDIFDANQPVIVSLVQPPPYGTLVLNTNGTFSYQPATGSYGTYYFTYRLTQGDLTSDAQVELNITPVNDPPSLQDATVTISDDYVNSQYVLTMTLYDADPGSYSFQILSGNSAGVFAISSGGIIQVADASLLNAATTASYSLVVQVTENDDPALVDTATVVITVTAAQSYETSVLPDTSFAGGSLLSLEMMLSGENNDPVQMIPLSDGRSLVIGSVSNSYQHQVFVMRLNPDGSVDSSYASKGLFRNSFFSSYSTEQAVAGVLTSNNELVLLVNYTEMNASGFYLMKLGENGLLDYGFGPGSQGYLLCEYSPCDSGDMQATDLLLNHNGHYVVSGVKNGSQAFLFEFTDSGYQGGWLSTLSTVKQFDLVRQDSNHNYYGIGQSPTNRIVIARFSSSFALDSSTFGCTPTCVGYKEYDFSLYSSKAYDAVLYSDELYVVGSVTESSSLTSPDGVFFKLTPDGSLNPGFGNAAGFIQISGNAGYPLHYQSLAVDPHGFYVLTSTAESEGDRVSLSHYNLNGDFMSDQRLAVDGQLKAVDLQSDGAGLWLLNHFSHPNYGAVGSVSFNWIGKYQQNTLAADTAFSADGQRWFSAGFSEDVLLGSQRLLMGSQVNKTLFYGRSYSYLNSGYQQFFVGRLTASGALDQSFGNHGLVLLATNQLGHMSISTIEEAGSNQAYVAGYGMEANGDQVGYVVRLNQNGSLDSGFANGVFALAPAAAGSYGESVARQLQIRSDGRLLVGAEYRSYANYSTDVVLLQLNTDGSVDTGNFGSSLPGYTVFSEIDPNAVIEEELSQMKLDPVDGSLVIAGQYKLSTDPQLYIARFSDTGVLMNTSNSPSDAFGQSGQGYSLINLIDNSNNPTSHFESLNLLDFDAGRNPVLALASYSEGADQHYLYRLQHNGGIDTSFNYGTPRPYNSFSNSLPVNLKIKQLHVDASGRLLLAGTSGAFAWVGRVLLDGSGTDVGRWDPAFEANSANYGAYLFSDVTSSYDLFMELTSSKVTLGWSNYDSNGYSATLRQYQFYEFQNNPI